MDRKSKIDPVLKVELVKKYLRNEISTSEAARRAGLSGNGTDAFRKWIDIYRNEGSAGLLDFNSRHFISCRNLL